MEKLTKVVDGVAWMLLFLVLTQIGVCNNINDIDKSLKELNKSVIELNTTIKNKEKINE